MIVFIAKILDIRLTVLAPQFRVERKTNKSTSYHHRYY